MPTSTHFNRYLVQAGIALSLSLAPASATVSVLTLKPSLASPQAIGKSINWTATATDTNPGPLTFEFSVAPPGSATYTVWRQFNIGTLTGTTWSPAGWGWTPTGPEGTYHIRVTAKDFKSGESATKTATFHVSPLVTAGMPVVVATANPLLPLFSNPACPKGSTVRVSFQPQSGMGLSFNTNSGNCTGTTSNTFEIAGMYPSTAYTLFAQVTTAGNTVNGPPVTFTTGALPAGVPFPTFTSVVSPGPNTDTPESVILHGEVTLAGGKLYPQIATDLNNNVLWYSYTGPGTGLLTRPLQDGGFLVIEGGPSWNPQTNSAQFVRQRDLAGHIVRETNIGILSQQLVALGDTNAVLCNTIASPAPVGSACLGGFHHEAMQELPNGDTAVLVSEEKIYPPGTQGDTTGMPVDIIGDVIAILDANWNAVWYFDAFQHSTQPGQLDYNRGPIGGDTCTANQSGCPPVLLISPGISPKAMDWLHANSVYYWPSTHDLIWSSRHQDWVMRVDYQDGTGSSNILWRMGPDGDFTFNNVNSDRWPWFSHQHEVAIESNGYMSILDNGNTRVGPPPLGLGKGCKPNDCNSRGMVLSFDETAKQVTPILSQDLGYYSSAMGSAQLLSNGNYFFEAAFVLSAQNLVSYSIELLLTPGTVNGTSVSNINGPESYRSWRMADLYNPPIS
jgi:arylsulfate sulfotransferase